MIQMSDVSEKTPLGLVPVAGRLSETSNVWNQSDASPACFWSETKMKSQMSVNPSVGCPGYFTWQTAPAPWASF